MTQQEINNIKQTVRIEEVIGRYLTLTRKGKSLLGLCPFHEDRHPSFAVHPQKQCFTCFACGEKGDVIGFLQKIEKVSFAEAVNMLGGDKATGAVQPPKERPVVQARKEQPVASAVPLSSFLTVLTPAASGDSELTPAWLDFEVGTSPALVAEEWRPMRNRLVFPIRNEEGLLVGFGARRLTENPDIPKYINSPTSELYRKNELLYGLNRARKAITEKQCVVLVEGYKDVLAMHAAGFTNTVALCGTALCDGHITLLKKHTSRVLVMMDADDAGRKASEKALTLLAMQGIQARTLELPEGEDPDSLFRLRGKEAFAGYVREKLAQWEPSEEALLLGRIREGIQALTAITDTETRVQQLRRLSIGMAHLTGLSYRQGRPATIDWRWV